MQEITKTPYHSWCVGGLPVGCTYCVHGKKLVLFITGMCAQRCFYCPVSEKKYGKDVVFANEWQIKDPDNPVELLEEAKLTKAQGAGITGGDPLTNIKRCVEYIHLLKKTFGKKFHVHLYTALKLVTEEKLRMLAEAGLDEIRFHPNLDDETLWERLILAKKFPWTIGVEIPAIPGYEEKIKKLMDYVRDKVSFVNINELESSDTQTAHNTLFAKGYFTKDDLSYGIKGSSECAQEMLLYAQSQRLKAHYCTAKLKDSVQVAQRLKLRSESIRRPADIVTEEGTLIRGVLYLPELTPGVGYREKLQTLDKETILPTLATLHQELMTHYNLTEKELFIDTKKGRLLCSKAFARKHKQQLKEQQLIPAIVEEYPTEDAIEVDVLFL